MLLLDQIAEARIEEAIARGELDNLPGAGQPLSLDEDPMVPEEYRMAYRILKNAGVVPPEIELRNRIKALEEALLAADDGPEKNRGLKNLHLLYLQLDQNRGLGINLALQEEYYQKVLRRLASGE